VAQPQCSQNSDVKSEALEALTLLQQQLGIAQTTPQDSEVETENLEEPIQVFEWRQFKAVGPLSLSLPGHAIKEFNSKLASSGLTLDEFFRTKNFIQSVTTCFQLEDPGEVVSFNILLKRIVSDTGILSSDFVAIKNDMLGCDVFARVQDFGRIGQAASDYHKQH